VQKLVILGTGGNCVDILDTVLAINAVARDSRLECVGFLDDDPRKHGTVIHGVPVLGSLEYADRLTDVWFVNGIGSPRNFWRKPEILARAGVRDERLATIIHPSAQISALASVEPGAVVLQNSVVASNARLGKHVIVLPLSVISHDTHIGDYSIIAGGVCISGNVRVGRACYIGSRCAIREGIVIGDYSLCGMGSNVLADVPERSVVVGNPARRLRAVEAT
jgi:sugar O-acyltransferase (sialic acid O-acetyltransferase NeuD family)